ncbi:hypothetical protein TNCV_1178401 [Trichonephila clavipes]|nr:hypothetical protein TNCV_1178401 [Trichonephila clavipes]
MDVSQWGQTIVKSLSIRRLCVQRTCTRLTTSYNTCRRPFSICFARRRTSTLPQLVADYFEASGRRIFATQRSEDVFTMDVSMQDDQLCCAPQRTIEKGPLIVSKSTCFLAR